MHLPICQQYHACPSVIMSKIRFKASKTSIFSNKKKYSYHLFITTTTLFDKLFTFTNDNYEQFFVLVDVFIMFRKRKANNKYHVIVKKNEIWNLIFKRTEMSEGWRICSIITLTNSTVLKRRCCNEVFSCFLIVKEALNSLFSLLKIVLLSRNDN